MERDEGDRIRRRCVQATSTVTPFERNCTDQDWLDVRIATDKKLMDRYADHHSKVQAMFAEVAEVYWKECCVWIYMMWSYESTVGVGNSNWITPNG